MSMLLDVYVRVGTWKVPCLAVPEWIALELEDVACQICQVLLVDESPVRPPLQIPLGGGAAVEAWKLARVE